MSNTADELPECPLCMEVFELDDLNFFPCTCGYQICRFCWHRLRTDENGLCPACRKSYPEDPAQFKPLTDEEIHQIKRDRRQKETQRKQKSAENRKHLINVRVVQKNLVFVVGLVPRLTDPEILKRHEYFGKFGKIHKVVINQSTSYVGSQGPSASAYVTYVRPEDALGAIKVVNNLQVDGRTIKASLGTTKYCSHFLKGTQCLKQDCMYLHDLGDEAASFTKEEIQQGKHIQYEQKLYEQYLSSTSTTNSLPETAVKTQPRPKEVSPSNSRQLSPVSCPSVESNSANGLNESATQPPPPSPPTANDVKPVTVTSSEQFTPISPSTVSPLHQNNVLSGGGGGSVSRGGGGGIRPLLSFPVSPDDHLSLFSDSGFPLSNRKQPMEQSSNQTQHTSNSEDHVSPPTTDIPETIPVNSSTDWQEAFGFSSNNTDLQDDDLGFDPYVVSAKGLADMIENEKAINSVPPIIPPLSKNICRLPSSSSSPLFLAGSRSKVMPPGFAPTNGCLQPRPNANHIVSLQNSKMLNYVQFSSGLPHLHPVPPSHSLYGSDQVIFGPRKQEGVFHHPLQSAPVSSVHHHHHQPNSAFNLQEWQDGLKALLPNINISFGTQKEHGSGMDLGFGPRPVLPIHAMQRYPTTDKSWCSLGSQSMPDLSWDPAIINSGAVSASDCLSTEEPPPHWMASIHHLTDDHHPTFVHPSSHSMSWLLPSPTRFPPPGFVGSSTSRQLVADKQNLVDHKLPAS